MSNNDNDDGIIHRMKHNAFVADVIATNDQNAAYRKVYDCSSMTDKAVTIAACKLMKLPHIVEAITNYKKKLQERSLMSVAEVMQEFIDIVKADPTKLIQYRKHNCRYCHGHNFNYRWIDGDEWAKAIIEAQQFNANKSAKAPPREMPNDNGGYGFDVKQRPNPACPRCAGEGYPFVWIADTRDLTGAEKRLFAGIKQTPNGVQILMRDQDGALKNLASIMGMFIDRVIVNQPTGIVGDQEIPTNAEDASRMYQAMIRNRNAGN